MVHRKSFIDLAGSVVCEQEEHHRKRSFSVELKLVVDPYGLKCHQDETVETVSQEAAPTPPAESGVLMRGR